MKKMYLAIFFALILIPFTVASASKPEGPINVLNTNINALYTFIPQGNGNTKLIVELSYDWECSTHPEFNGHAYQIATGIAREKENGMHFDSLSGYGVFTSTGVEGTITYKIHNNFMYEPFGIFADRLTLWKGTGYFEDIHGYAELVFENMSFDMYVHYD